MAIYVRGRRGPCARVACAIDMAPLVIDVPRVEGSVGVAVAVIVSVAMSVSLVRPCRAAPIDPQADTPQEKIIMSARCFAPPEIARAPAPAPVPSKRNRVRALTYRFA